MQSITAWVSFMLLLGGGILISGCEKKLTDDPWFQGRPYKLFNEVKWNQVPSNDIVKVPKAYRDRAGELLSAKSAVLVTTETFGTECIKQAAIGDSPREWYLIRVINIPNSGLWVYRSPDGMVATHVTALGDPRPANHWGVLVSLPSAPSQIFVEANFAK